MDKPKLMKAVQGSLEKEGVTGGGSIFRNVVDAVLRELGYDGQAQARIETLSAENSAQHQEIIRLRRENERLRRTVGDLFQDLVESNEAPWHSAT